MSRRGAFHLADFRGTHRLTRNPLSYHAGTLAFYPFVLLVLAVVAQNPVYLFAQLLVTVAALALTGTLRVFARLLRYGFVLLLLVLAINVLVTKDGMTLLWLGPKLPVLGTIRVTAEAFGYGLAMVVRLLAVFAAGVLYMTWLSPDRALTLIAKVAGRSAVTAMLTARLLPYLSEQAEQVGDVMRTRGVRLAQGGVIQRIKARQPLLNVLLVSSLEGSWSVAEAMEARGFGQGRRTTYSKERWSRRDALAWIAMLAALGLTVWMEGADILTYSFYPQMEILWDLDGRATTLVAFDLLLLLVPPLWMKRRSK